MEFDGGRRGDEKLQNVGRGWLFRVLPALMEVVKTHYASKIALPGAS